MKTYIFPCPKDPVIDMLEIDVYSSEAEGILQKVDFTSHRPNATITRLEKSDEHPSGGWHVEIDCTDGNRNATGSFDIICSSQSNRYYIKNSHLSYSGSYSGSDYDVRCSCSGSIKDLQYDHEWSSAPEGVLNKTFSMQYSLSGTGSYSEKKDGQVTKTVSLTPTFSVDIGFAYE